MAFPLGKPILILALVGALAGGVDWLKSRPTRADLVVWVFADDDARTFRQPAPGGWPGLIDQFRQVSGKSVEVDLIAQRALDERLISLFMSARPPEAENRPDLVEIDISSVGKFFRPPVDEVGLMPLNGFLKNSNDLKDLVHSRLATWSKDGVIFGIPRDVHPVTITYRKDLFDQAAVDLEAPQTWPQFQQACLKFQRYWAAHGEVRRRAMELYSTESEELLLMLLQRHIQIVDARNRIHLSDAKVAQTVAFYAQMVAGPRRIGADTIANFAFAYRDLADGNVCAMITPDWRAGYIKQYAPELSGKLRMRPLPIFEPGDQPTSTWGGMMMGIVRGCKDPQAAWNLLKFLCLSPQAEAARHRYSLIIPPLASQWSDPIYQQDDPFFENQPVEKLYVSLARRVPRRNVTPFSLTAQAALTLVLDRAVNYIHQNGSDQGLEAQCQLWLDQASAEVGQWVTYGDYQP